MPIVLGQILGRQYRQLIEDAKNGLPIEPKLKQAQPITPDAIKPVSLAAGVRGLIREETLKTGEREGSSLRHDSLYLEAKRPDVANKIKGSGRQP